MARTPNLHGRQVVKFFTNGKRANSQYDLADQVGRIVKRLDAVRIKAAVSTSRRASPISKSVLASRFSIATSQISGRVSTYVSNDTIRVLASTLKFPLSLFRGQWDGRRSPGASAEILIGQRQVLPGTFIAPGRFRGNVIPMMYSRDRGHKVTQKYGRYAGQTRESIFALRGPSTYQMLVGRDADGTRILSGSEIPADIVQRQLIDIYISELKRLYAVESKNG